MGPQSSKVAWSGWSANLHPASLLNKERQDSKFNKVYLIIEDQPGNGPYDSIRNVIAVYDNLKDAKKYIESYDQANLSDNEVFIDEWDINSSN